MTGPTSIIDTASSNALDANVPDGSVADTSAQGRLLQSIDDGCSNLLRDCSWKASLDFKVHRCLESDPLTSTCEFLQCNLFELTAKVCGLGGQVARFEPKLYPPATNGIMKGSDSWKKLSDDLMRVSTEGGGSSLNVVINYGGKKDRAALACSHGRAYRQSKAPRAGGAFRTHTFNRDKLNARSNKGLEQKKKTSTSKPIAAKNEETCKVKLVIGMDAQSFMLICGNGDDTHEGHPSLAKGEMPLRKRLINENAEKEAKQMAIHGGRPGLICGMVQEKHGLEMTRRQALSLTQMAKLANDLIGTENLEQNQHHMSDTDRVFDYLTRNGGSYVALYHQQGDCDPERPATKKKKSSGTLVVESVSSSGESTSDVVSDTGIHEKNEDVMKYAIETRNVVGADDDQSVLVALVWTTPQGKQFFQAFPEQVSVDGTHDATNEEWELLTFSIQDMNGGQETVIRCWAPNNRNWLYRWLFHEAVPLLVGKSACKRSHLIICDGDPQECSQLDTAIVSVFPNAKRRRCGWHVVDRGWNSHFGKNLGGKNHKNRKRIDKLIREIKNWLYSLMKDIETEEEYKV